MNEINFYRLVLGAALGAASMSAAAADSASDTGVLDAEVATAIGDGVAAQPANSADASGLSRDDAAIEAADKQSQELRSRKARDGRGYGAGPGGERGLGTEGAPHHQQYGSPPRGADE